ncbi:hypothetical protein [Thermobispora bispora]|nr:hypothetical protein [Thermobispora bispora]MDI9580998.1 hypothetical protein [Thermobispora sp.]
MEEADAGADAVTEVADVPESIDRFDRRHRARLRRGPVRRRRSRLG